LKPGVLTDNRGVHRLDGNVLGIQLKTLNETLENKENHIETEIEFYQSQRVGCL